MRRTTGTCIATGAVVVALEASTRQSTQSAGCTRAQLAVLCASTWTVAPRIDSTSARASATDAKVGSTSWKMAASSQPTRRSGERECTTKW
jgi:hypothetical protein